MRLSKFEKYFIWLLATILVFMVVPKIIVNDEYMYMSTQRLIRFIILFLNYANIFLVHFMLIGILEDIISFKYKIVKTKTGNYNLKYLTVGYFFIPYWKNASYFGNQHSSVDDAKYSVYGHKETRRDNLKEFFKKPKIKIEETHYI